MRRLAAAGERDGLTIRETAARAGMAAGTLAWWRSEIRRRDAVRAKGEAAPVFIEVVAADHRVAASSAQAGGVGNARPPDADENCSANRSKDGDAPHVLEVELRCGRRLRVAASYGLARLVREIEAC